MMSPTEREAFLLSLQPQIEHMAYAIVRKMYSPVDPQDLIQEGLMAAWQCLERRDAGKEINEHSFTGFCIFRARGAMLNSLTRENKVPATSLEQYLEIKTDEGTAHRGIVDMRTSHRQTTLRQRRLVLAGLRKLTRRERLCIMAAFRIDNERGKSPTASEIQARLHITASGFDSNKCRALKKLPALMSYK